MNLLYDLNALQTFLVDYYHLTGCRVAIFDDEYNEILAYPTRYSTFCSLLHGNSEMSIRCDTCDLAAFERCKITRKTIIYQCHLGFTEIISPIFHSGDIIAFLMCGQIRSELSWDEIAERLAGVPIDLTAMQADFLRQKQVSASTIHSAANVLSLCGNQLYSDEAMNKKRNSLSAKIDTYILDHIQDPLDVETLCNAFGFKKTNFYSVTNKLYGVGIRKHIQRLRVQSAKKLLSSTDYPISQIAEMVGIDDYNYFTKVFKRESASTPSEFRKNTLSQYK